NVSPLFSFAKMVLHRAMFRRRTSLQPDIRRQFRGQADARAKNAHDERVAGFDDFDAATDANAKCFKALNVLAFAFKPADDSARFRRKLVETNFLRKNRG